MVGDIDYGAYALGESVFYIGLWLAVAGGILGMIWDLLEGFSHHDDH